MLQIRDNFVLDLCNQSRHGLSKFESPLSGKEIELLRYPDRVKDLFAWDAADIYLLSEFADRFASWESGNDSLCVWVLNDNFGALIVPLVCWALENGKTIDIVCYTDSYLALRTMERNLLLNKVQKRGVSLSFVHDPGDFVEQQTPDVVIGRVPKAKSQLAYLLATMRKLIAEGGPLLLGGMDKHLSKGQYDLIEKCYGESSFLPGKKKARVWCGRARPGTDYVVEEFASYELPNGKTLVTMPNAFSYARLDIGARLFIENMKLLPKRDCVIDLACGNGVLGLSYVIQHSPKSICFSDESFQAISATRKNWNTWNDDGILSEIQTIFRVDHGLKQQSDTSAELVLLNPPFHLQNSIAKTMAKDLFVDAMRCLVEGGELWVVANRHLGYHALLKQLFGNCKVSASNKKFVLLRSVRR